MKRIFLSLLLIVGLSINASCEDYHPRKKATVEFKDSITKDTYTIQNVKYSVFKSKNGAFYIWKISKRTGKKYKYYLPKYIQEQIGRVYKK